MFKILAATLLSFLQSIVQVSLWTCENGGGVPKSRPLQIGGIADLHPDSIGGDH